MIRSVEFREKCTDISIGTYHEAGNSPGQHNTNSNPDAPSEEFGGEDALVEQKDRDLNRNNDEYQKDRADGNGLQRSIRNQRPNLCIWMTNLNIFLSRYERIHLDNVHSDLAGYDENSDSITPGGSLANLSQCSCKSRFTRSCSPD